MESAAMTDDGDRERILAALRDSEQRFRMLFERNAAGMNIADLSGRYLQVNKAFCEFLGRSSRELLELRHQDVVHPGDLDEVRGNMAEGGAKEVLRRFVRKDGSTVWGVLSAALVRPETGPPYWVGVVQDITARKLAEESLRHSEERFRALANDTSAYLWILSFENGEHRLFINQRVADFAGVDTQYLGQNWINYVHPEDRKQVLQEFSAAISEGRPFSLECRFRRSDGEYRWVLDRGVPRYNSTTGELTGYGGSLVDITERRHAEQQVIALSDRLISVQEEERSRIAAELHDGFGQQIAAASMLLSGIKRRLSEPRPSLQREIEEIENARGRLQAI
ncbi:MAG: PAS domain S-box protein, partial [Acidobacteriaceae bacterium]|nr:PAS domain S-box protein [Acidobacteriaceae bacterium]